MAKRTCDPTSGSIGSQTYLIGRNGQIVRTRAIPANPKTPAQQTARADFTTASKRWDSLTDDQRAAWRTAASDVMSKTRLGMNGKLTGNQYYVQVNAALAALGAPSVNVPPAAPEFTDIPVSGLTITNSSGTIAINLDTTDSPPDGTEWLSFKPVKPGVNRTPQLLLMGVLGSPSSNKVNLTADYAARFGAPTAGQRLFVGVREVINGLAGPITTYTAVVPNPAGSQKPKRHKAPVGK